MNYLPDAFTTCFTILSYSVLDILETLPCFFRTSNCSSTYFLAASLMLPLFCVCDICLFPPGFFKDRKSTRLNSSHSQISYAVFCLKKKERWLRALVQPLIEDSSLAGVYSRQVEREPCSVYALIQLRTAFGYHARLRSDPGASAPML